MTEADYARALKADAARCNAAMRKHWSIGLTDILSKDHLHRMPPAKRKLVLDARKAEREAEAAAKAVEGKIRLEGATRNALKMRLALPESQITKALHRLRDAGRVCEKRIDGENYWQATTTAAHSRPVPIRGVVYPSMSEAARAFDVSVQAIADAAAKGRLDGVGLRKAARAGNSPKQPQRGDLSAQAGVSGIPTPDRAGDGHVARYSERAA